MCWPDVIECIKDLKSIGEKQMNIETFYFGMQFCACHFILLVLSY